MPSRGLWVDAAHRSTMYVRRRWLDAQVRCLRFGDRSQGADAQVLERGYAVRATRISASRGSTAFFGERTSAVATRPMLLRPGSSGMIHWWYSLQPRRAAHIDVAGVSS